MVAASFKHRKPSPVSPLAPAHNLALFLDLDGTLLDIAPTPDAVVVPHDLVADLASASKALKGALAIVSGRGIESVDALLKPLSLPVGCEHGAIIRLPSGLCDEVEIKVPEEWKRAVQDLAAACPGVFAEIKRHNIVAHYRKAPAYEAAVRRALSDLVAEDPQNFELLEAKMAFEIRPRQVTKARAVHSLMNVAPFRGRRPVFVGDDTTDVDGFQAAVALGGVGLDVAPAFAGRPAEVRAWLKRFAEL